MPRSYHSMKLQDPHYDNILSGRKIYETRVNDPKRQAMKVGDIINITHDSDKTREGYSIVITDRQEYKTFRKAITTVGISKVLPGVKTDNEGIKIYESFPHKEGTYKEGAKKYGVVRFGLTVNVNPLEYELGILNPKDCPCFDLIKSGKKTVEGRKNAPKYQVYKPGDLLTFVCGKEKLETVITQIKKYKTVEDYLRKETLKKALPCVKTVQEGVEMYNRWTKESERNALQKKYGYGFLGIHVKLVK